MLLRRGLGSSLAVILCLPLSRDVAPAYLAHFPRHGVSGSCLCVTGRHRKNRLSWAEETEVA